MAHRIGAWKRDAARAHVLGVGLAVLLGASTCSCAASPAVPGPESSAAAERTGFASFTVTSTAMSQRGTLPTEFTCDGAATTPPLSWRGAPAGTTSFAVLMDHLPTGADAHWYWIVYDLPASVDHLDAGSTPPGILGTNSVNGRTAYAPPCSQGPGPKLYTVTVFALDAPPVMPASTPVTRDVLLSAISGHVLARSSLDVTYDRSSGVGAPQRERPSASASASSSASASASR